MNPSAALSGFRLMNTLAELDQLAGAGPDVPTDLRALNFAQSSVMYVEGPADDFLGATVRLVEIRRFDGTRDQVTGERCTNDIAGIPTPNRANRPYALYVVPKLVSVTFAATSAVAPCSTVTALSPLTRVGIGDFNTGAGRPQPPFGSRAIRTQADLNALLPSFLPGAVSAPYLQPDFSQVTLLFVAHTGDWDATSYVRIERAYENDDGSVDVIAEYCGNSMTGVPIHQAFALYAVPRFDDATRFTIIERIPGVCALPR